ncbi:D-tyrosyl-tRNA(Tyr) deacylase [Candidatus Woesebacteria bacterium RIFCSPLOWO2_01_FULL_39_61]|uniref:D-aminoacyl-tRNA deacylase n=1 Tax=Candidatus Woesebacteria bacterium RIFCSPHIGHO2_02_FULL_39_13 TaxID=1802505 RepID=A0A1F7Z2T8_9BACT|nr:MAG: D-tyrosyl-tRNA(Tyr) deacylase [Candidatus Woesebacteria bacterium RIFCSPHIGHO2_01_FULL_39_95]OGM33963.1 MAG: D-tyrosyl-tRNA(Tyr) deacylase [Candidatus Woesebacteria bacterium RIFCSPHIGHO2_02_FULL_39_13]OGM38221.1 MAG: D-tyrosyl-tRNA(Tyr) deacylase [Candidatus Woesebacteria bacterium RIFCSPHIGHO2_12_FULL_40_20]OGM66927.1 MAG: D-tyrosyl-tRNA(Tyr) deacylase [Candidatus Woesebacteria bacterium RIFCSPLOWO2_01_FULL_39_61]OGM72317.1 MAG: D-tyrosyl-tRNA(Tyr) deacylase [Candidatus Woesebacteria 
MRLVVQRVNKASVSVGSKLVGEIKKGLFVLVGIRKEDTEKVALELADKLVKLRIMSDRKGKMNLTVSEMNAEFLVVSQFTLLGDATGGNRPSFIQAAEPEFANKIYNLFINELKKTGTQVSTGQFGEYMNINCELDGPVTILINSKE